MPPVEVYTFAYMVLFIVTTIPSPGPASDLIISVCVPPFVNDVGINQVYHASPEHTELLTCVVTKL